MRRWVILGVVAVGLLAPAVAVASVARDAPTLLFPWQQVWPLVIGGLVPLATYVLNHVGPWMGEPVKAAVMVIATAAASALYTALATNVIGFNMPTLQLVLTGVAGAFVAHHWVWRPSGVSTLLGAGRNRREYRRSPAGGVNEPPAAPPRV